MDQPRDLDKSQNQNSSTASNSALNLKRLQTQSGGTPLSISIRARAKSKAAPPPPLLGSSPNAAIIPSTPISILPSEGSIISSRVVDSPSPVLGESASHSTTSYAVEQTDAGKKLDSKKTSLVDNNPPTSKRTSVVDNNPPTKKTSLVDNNPPTNRISVVDNNPPTKRSSAVDNNPTKRASAVDNNPPTKRSSVVDNPPSKRTSAVDNPPLSRIAEAKRLLAAHSDSFSMESRGSHTRGVTVKKTALLHAATTSDDTSREQPSNYHAIKMAGIIKEIGSKKVHKYAVAESVLHQQAVQGEESGKSDKTGIKNLLNNNLKNIIINQKLLNEDYEKQSSMNNLNNFPQAQEPSIRIDNSDRGDLQLYIRVTNLGSDNEYNDTVLIQIKDSDHLRMPTPDMVEPKDVKEEKKKWFNKKAKKDALPSMKEALRKRDAEKYTIRYHCTHLTRKQKVLYSICGFILLGALGALGYYGYVLYVRINNPASSDTTVTSASTFGTGAPGFVDGNAATAKFNQPSSVAVDSTGNIYVADTSNSAIRKISPAGTVSTLSSSTSPSSSKKRGATVTFVAPVGLFLINTTLYVSDQGDNTIKAININSGEVTRVAGSGNPNGNDGLYSSASFYLPNGLALWNNTSILVADQGNCNIRELKAVGSISTFAGTGNSTKKIFANGAAKSCSFNSPAGIAVDSKNNAYIADTMNNCIRQINGATGQVSTFAGSAFSSGFADGTGSAARFNGPTNLVIDSTDTLYVSDSANKAIRIISSSGVVTTVGGYAKALSSSEFSSPQGLAISPSGNLIVADPGRNTIAVITQSQTGNQIVPVTISNPPANLVSPSTQQSNKPTLYLSWITGPANETYYAGSNLQTIAALIITDSIGSVYASVPVNLAVFSDDKCSINRSTANLLNSVSTTDNQGMANFMTFSFTKPGSYYLVAYAVLLDLTSTCSSMTYTILPGPATFISFAVQPSISTGLVNTPFYAGMVLLTDSFGNPVPNASVTLSVTTSSRCDSTASSVYLYRGTITQSVTTLTNANGYAVFDSIIAVSASTVTGYLKVSYGSNLFNCSSQTITIVSPIVSTTTTISSSTTTAIPSSTTTAILSSTTTAILSITTAAISSSTTPAISSSTTAATSGAITSVATTSLTATTFSVPSISPTYSTTTQ